MFAPLINLFDKHVAFDNDASTGDLIIAHSQDIPADHISQLKRDKINADHDRYGDMVKAFSIPVLVVEDWAKKGFHIAHESNRAIANRLRAEGLDAFILNDKVF